MKTLFTIIVMLISIRSVFALCNEGYICGKELHDSCK